MTRFRSKQNIVDFLHGNSYLVFFFSITLLSELWCIFHYLPSRQLTVTTSAWLVILGLNAAYLWMLSVVGKFFRQYRYWLNHVNSDSSEQITKICKERNIDFKFEDKSYDDKRFGFVYLEEMVEMKLKC